MIGNITVSAKEANLTLRCNALATDKNQQILFLSIAGSGSAIKAVNAVLHCKSQVAFFVENLPEPFADFDGYARIHPAGYRIQKAKLDQRTWHLVASTCLDGFIPNLSPRSLWRMLHSDRYSTPLLAAWVPWLQRHLEDDGCLWLPDRFGCEAGVLQLDSTALDKLVSKGLRTGQLEVRDVRENLQP